MHDSQFFDTQLYNNMTDTKKVVNLSTFLQQCKEYVQLKPKATFWFGAVLSAID